MDESHVISRRSGPCHQDTQRDDRLFRKTMFKKDEQAESETTDHERHNDLNRQPWMQDVAGQ